ncbi:MAG: orotate phosphoribosyltransferase [Candidatus Dormibacteraeota bacterium]|nr:orotate phosphoribosyltransferase [Candidatus Dormibacteraeota bacterium]
MPEVGDSDERARLARDMVDAAWLEGDFVLRSGRRSRYYFDKYLFETQPSILRRVGRELARLVPPETQRLAAPELGAVLLGGAVSLELDLPLVIVRKGEKGYGTSKLLEGRLGVGERVTLLEDVLTTAGEAVNALTKVREAGGEVICLVGVLDREEGAAERLAEAGVPFRPLFRRSDLPVPGSPAGDD